MAAVGYSGGSDTGEVGAELKNIQRPTGNIQRPTVGKVSSERLLGVWRSYAAHAAYSADISILRKAM